MSGICRHLGINRLFKRVAYTKLATAKVGIQGELRKLLQADSKGKETGDRNQTNSFVICITFPLENLLKIKVQKSSWFHKILIKPFHADIVAILKDSS